MAGFTPKKIDISKINGGMEYKNGDGISPSTLNECVEGVAYSNEQIEALVQAPDISEIDGEGTPSVEFVDTEVNGRAYKKLKFKNLKGKQGESGQAQDLEGFLKNEADKEAIDCLAIGGARAYVRESTAIGKYATADGEENTAIGDDAMAYSNRAVAIGSGALVSNKGENYGVAIGARARVDALGAIQIGVGLNDNPQTFQVRDFTLLDKDGIIPNDRLQFKAISADIYFIENPTAKTYYVQNTGATEKAFAYLMKQSDFNGNYWTKTISNDSINPKNFLPSGKYMLTCIIDGLVYFRECQYSSDEITGVLLSDNNDNIFAPFKLLGDGDHTNYEVNQLNSIMYIGDGIISFTIYGYGDYSPSNGYTLPNIEFVSLKRVSPDENDGVMYFYDGTQFNMVGAKTSALPSVTASDVGKILRVNANGEWVAESLPSAEGVSF